MPQPLSGPGVGLQLPSSLYPTQLASAPVDISSNMLDLAAGTQLPIPAGNWYIHPGKYSLLQYLDPINGIWRAHQNQRRELIRVKSDGFTLRLANLLNCPVAAVVTNAGSGYSQATATCVANTGGSLWTPVVGGMLSVNSVTAAGANYGAPPLVLIPPPPVGGVQATAYASIASGTVSGITLSNVGGGYSGTSVSAQIVPNPTDPNLSAGITNATVSLAVVGAGSIAAVLCTNPGNPAAPTLTIAGAGGSSATATAVRMQTATGFTVQSGGTGFTANGLLFTVGGVTTATPVITNPDIELRNFMARPAQASLFASGGSLISVSTLYDGGLFVGTPLVVAVPQSGSVATTGASITATLGAAPDTIMIQPSP